MCENTGKILDRLYAEHDPSKLSYSCLEAFKKWHVISAYCRFKESDTVKADLITDNLPRLVETLEQYNDILNMD